MQQRHIININLYHLPNQDIYYIIITKKEGLVMISLIKDQFFKKIYNTTGLLFNGTIESYKNLIEKK